MALSAARGSRQPAAPGTVTPHVAMSWAQRLRRLFGIDIETRERCPNASEVRIGNSLSPAPVASSQPYCG
jgi:hypothetical protein